MNRLPAEVILAWGALVLALVLGLAAGFYFGQRADPPSPPTVTLVFPRTYYEAVPVDTTYEDGVIGIVYELRPGGPP